MKELQPVEHTNNMVYKLVARDGDAVIYSQHLLSTLHKPIGYEVFRVRRQEATTSIIKGVEYEIEAKEKFPSTSEWGKEAWSITKLDRAMERYNELRTYLSTKRR